MNKLRYAFAEPENVKDKKENEDTINSILERLNKQDEEIKKLKKENEELKKEKETQTKIEKDENKKEKTKDTHTKTEQEKLMEEYLEQMKKHNQNILDSKKDEIAKKFNLDKKELEQYNTIESLANFENIYSRAYKNGNDSALDEKNLIEVLKKQKKMIMSMENIGNKEEEKLKQEEKTKKIFDFFKKK